MFQDGSDVLKKMLNIADHSEPSKSSEAASTDGGGGASEGGGGGASEGGGGGGKSYGRQVSIQELFDGECDY